MSDPVEWDFARKFLSAIVGDCFVVVGVFVLQTRHRLGHSVSGKLQRSWRWEAVAGSYPKSSKFVKEFVDQQAPCGEVMYAWQVSVFWRERRPFCSLGSR